MNVIKLLRILRIISELVARLLHLAKEEMPHYSEDIVDKPGDPIEGGQSVKSRKMSSDKV